MKITFIKFKKPHQLLQIFATMILGILLGAILMSLAIAYRIDELSLENQNLLNEISKAYEENDNLKQQLEEKNRLQKLKVETIDPIIIFPADTFTRYEEEALKLELEKKIKSLLKDLKGQEVNTLDYRLIPQIINARHLNVLGRNLKIQVESTVVAKNISIYVNVVPVKEQINSDV